MESKNEAQAILSLTVEQPVMRQRIINPDRKENRGDDLTGILFSPIIKRILRCSNYPKHLIFISFLIALRFDKAVSE